MLRRLEQRLIVTADHRNIYRSPLKLHFVFKTLIVVVLIREQWDGHGARNFSAMFRMTYSLFFQVLLNSSQTTTVSAVPCTGFASRLFCAE